MKKAKKAICLVVIFAVLSLVMVPSLFIGVIAAATSSGSSGAAGSLITSEIPEILTDEIVNACMEADKSYGVPASILLAQVICDGSGDFKKNLNQVAYECKNLFKRKGKGPCGYKVYEEIVTDSNGNSETISVKYRKYRSFRQCIKEQAELYVTGKYSAATKKCKAVSDWAEAIAKVGYSDRIGYADELLDIISLYDLERFDNGGMKIGDGILRGNFIWPTVKGSVITSYFGTREIGIGSKNHPGIDIGVYGDEPGAAIFAADGGIVEATGKTVTAGNYVRIDHGGGTVTVYMHMQNNSICVRKGQKVSQGQKIGRMGSTGRSSGTHLHFEIRINGIAVDPLNFIKK